MVIRARDYKLYDLLIIPIKNSPFWSIITIAVRIFNALLPSLQIYVTAKFIDTAVAIFEGKAERGQIMLPLFLTMGIISYQNIIRLLMDLIDLRINIKMTENFRQAIVEKRARLEYKHIENNDSWDLISRTCKDPVGRIRGGMGDLLGAVDLIIRVVSILMVLMTQVWWAGLLIILICVPLFYIAAKAGKTTYEANKEAEKHHRRGWYLSYILTGRELVEERTLFSFSEHVNEIWHEKYETARKISQRAELKRFIKMKGSSLITVFINLAIIGVLIPAVGSGEITIGMFMGLVTASLNLVQMMSWQLTWITSQMANIREYLKDLSEFSKLSEQDSAVDLPSDMSGFEFESIEFKNVSFKYPGTERYILKNCSFKLRSKMHYAFVGVNGAGKTTITKLLTGMYDNYEGEIYINGKNLRDYSLPELKGIFSVVYQDFARYSIPLKDNIKLGNVLTDDDERLKESINNISLDEAVGKLPDGVNTWLGKIKEEGVDLSGGEWQKVAIARNLYSGRPVSILDEPTAALDPVAESNIYEMFGRISAAKSTIFITHRLGAARLADEILVIDDGRVAEQGNHSFLVELDGIYAKMYESQKGWYEA
ncbi:MAG: ABC transporter ATP-binding protein [Clostridiales bacterium]|nr:ABC transporter ATP-binding protein [Clostridiales bacterium]